MIRLIPLLALVPIFAPTLALDLAATLLALLGGLLAAPARLAGFRRSGGVRCRGEPGGGPGGATAEVDGMSGGLGLVRPVLIVVELPRRRKGGRR